VGFDRGGLLTEAIAKTPHAVLLLDEIEKAHPDVFSVLLQVMDHGTLTDNNGKKSDFRHVVLIMTSNVGARELTQVRVGFGERGFAGEDDKAYKNMFSPEFRNRLDARIQFKALDKGVMGSIVDKFVKELGAMLADKGVTISVTERARAWLGDKGYDPQNGARPLARVIDAEVKTAVRQARARRARRGRRGRRARDVRVHLGDGRGRGGRGVARHRTSAAFAWSGGERRYCTGPPVFL
jgi:ATP-dependent Clp protease ATP-binding subunit ClpA